MATGAPLNRITLGAASVADDLGFVESSTVVLGLGPRLCHDRDSVLDRCVSGGTRSAAAAAAVRR